MERGLIEGLHRERLPNGAGLWLLPMPGQAMVSLRLLVPAGAQHEAAGEAGVAHLVEHLVFDTTRTPEMARVDSAVVDGGGDLGAMAGPEDVVFSAEAPRELLEDVLELACACIRTATFERERVEDERRVLLRELEDCGEDGGKGALSRRVWERLLGGHPSTRDPAGEPRVVESISVERLEAFFRARYLGAGMSLVLAGDLEIEPTRELARRTVGALPDDRAPDEPDEPDRPVGPLLLREPEARDELIVGYRTDGSLDRDYHALWCIRDHLSEELYEEIRRAHHVYNLACEMVARRTVGLVHVHVRASDSDHDAIAARVDESFAALAAGPLDAAVFSRLRSRLVNRTRRILETSDEAAEHLLSLATHHGVDDQIPDDLQILSELTAESVRAAAQRTFVPERRVEARSRRGAVSRGIRRWLALGTLVLLLLGLQDRCHRAREDELERSLDECRSALSEPTADADPPAPRE